MARFFSVKPGVATGSEPRLQFYKSTRYSSLVVKTTLKYPQQTTQNCKSSISLKHIDFFFNNNTRPFSLDYPNKEEGLKGAFSRSLSTCIILHQRLRQR